LANSYGSQYTTYQLYDYQYFEYKWLLYFVKLLSRVER